MSDGFESIKDLTLILKALLRANSCAICFVNPKKSIHFDSGAIGCFILVLIFLLNMVFPLQVAGATRDWLESHDFVLLISNEIKIFLNHFQYTSQARILLQPLPASSFDITKAVKMSNQVGLWLQWN